MSRRPSDLPPGGRNPRQGGQTPPPSPTRWLPWLIIGVLLVGGLFFFNFGRTTESKADLSYTQFQKAVDNGTVKSVEFGLKGDTATGANKPATLESGLKVNVPLFVNQGDKIKVDTRTGEYIERAS